MFRLPEHYHNLSVRLSEVLDDIGVNGRMVKKRQRSALLTETSLALANDISLYNFGSKSEGTTTIGLNSDIDILYVLPSCTVIQNYAEWKPGFTNLLMKQGDITAPGYCRLQLIRDDMPLPATNILDQHCFRDEYGGIFLKNTFCHHNSRFWLRNGPARTIEGQSGLASFDAVCAMSCESWPTEARDLRQRCLGEWPTEDMKRYAEKSGCFVVPVGSKINQTETLEWRISYSKAERYLMFNLNITQIRCFVLLKMILKTYLEHRVSSYMCKTVLLRCIEKTHYDMWKEKNLLACLTVCLQALRNSVLNESCPHFFNPENNLMERKFSPRMKEKLQKSLYHILEGQGAALFGIKIDDLGDRLAIKMNQLHQSVQSVHLLSANDTRLLISGNLILKVAVDACNLVNLNIIPKGDIHLRSPLKLSQDLMQFILKFIRLHENGTKTERKALQLLEVPFLCSSLGSVLASIHIGRNYSLSPESLNWLSVGLNSDISSGRLKLASVLYCAGDMLGAESILRETERLYHLESVQLHVPAITLQREE